MEIKTKKITTTREQGLKLENEVEKLLKDNRIAYTKQYSSIFTGLRPDFFIEPNFLIECTTGSGGKVSSWNLHKKLLLDKLENKEFTLIMIDTNARKSENLSNFVYYTIFNNIYWLNHDTYKFFLPKIINNEFNTKGKFIFNFLDYLYVNKKITRKTFSKFHSLHYLFVLLLEKEKYLNPTIYGRQNDMNYAQRTYLYQCLNFLTKMNILKKQYKRNIDIELVVRFMNNNYRKNARTFFSLIDPNWRLWFFSRTFLFRKKGTIAYKNLQKHKVIYERMKELIQ